MTEETQNSIAEVETSPEVQRTAWSTTLFWGLLLGAIVSLVAALRHRLKIAEEEALPRYADRDNALLPPARMMPDMTVSDIGSAAGGRSPVASTGRKAAVSVSVAASDTPKPSLSRPVPPPSQPPSVTGSSTPGIPHPAQSTRWREPTKYVVGVGLCLTLLLILYISRSVIPVIIVAALLAMIVHPVIGLFQRRLKFSRGLSIALTYLLIIGVLVLIPLIVMPAVVGALNDLVNLDFQGWSQTAAEAFQELSASVAPIPIINGLLGPFLDSLSAALLGVSQAKPPEAVPYQVALSGIVSQLAQTLGTIAKVLGPVVSAVISLVFMLLVSFHLSLSGHRILEGYPRLLPPAFEPEITGLIQRMGGVWTSFLRGQFALMAIIGVMVWLGNAILGNRYAVLLGLTSGLLEIIPNLGPALALIPGVSFALIFGSSHFSLPPLTFAIIVLAFYLLVQVFENQVIVPYVLGGELDVPPLVVIIGVMVGGTVAGILGVLIATPAIATGRELFSYLYDKILEPPEMPTPPEEKPSLLERIRGRVTQLSLPFRRRTQNPPAPEQKTEES